MTSKKDQEAQVSDPIGDAITRANELRYDWMRAQGSHKTNLDGIEERKAKAKAAYDKIIAAESEKESESRGTVEAAYQALLDYQSAKSEELGIDLNVVLQPAGGGKSL